jgi:hypothetical protein
MALAKNTSTEPKDAKYIKNVIADYRPRGFGFARGTVTCSESVKVFRLPSNAG